MPIVELAASIGGQKAANALQPLLRDLMDIQDRQLELLHAMQDDVRKLVEGPWRRARMALEDAQSLGGSRQVELLQQAESALREAHSYEAKASAARAAAAADLALVTSLLGHRGEGQKWARRAHQDGQQAILADIPEVTRALNAKGNPFSRAADGMRRSHDKKYFRWPTRSEVDKYAKAAMDASMWRQAFTRTFSEGIALGDSLAEDDLAKDLAVLGLPAGNKKAEFAHLLVENTQRTIPGARLMALHRLGRDTEDYREVRIQLCHDAGLPAERLRVDVTTPYSARIGWEAA